MPIISRLGVIDRVAMTTDAVCISSIRSCQHKRPPPPSQRSKLSAGALRAICQRNPSPEVRVLLWEIYRLQDVARQAQAISTVARVWGVDKPFLARLDILDSALFAEPCLWERPVAWSTDEEQAPKRLSRGRR